MQRHHIGDNHDSTANAASAESADNEASAETNANTAGSTTGSRPASAANTNSKNALNPPLPPGWDYSFSDKGRMFFIDHANKTTSWIDPRNGKPSPVPNLDFETRIGALPVSFLKLYLFME
jgi:E3 ubiquitin-protein ligase NEDD4